MSGSDSFMAFLTPENPIHLLASRCNQFELNSEKRLCFRGEPVEEGRTEDQLSRFINWLQERSQSPVVLVGHNCNSFIAPRLAYHLKRHGLENFGEIVMGFLDTLTLSKAAFSWHKELCFNQPGKGYRWVQLRCPFWCRRSTGSSKADGFIDK